MNLEDEVAWYERELSDYDLDLESYDEAKHCEYEDEDHARMRKPKRRYGNSNNTRKPRETREDGHVYPFDVWCLLSRYIDPEDVSRFACICTATHLITHMQSFWINIYKRFCTDKRFLPAELQAEMTERVQGLKERVVRAVFHTYRPFGARVIRVHPIENLSRQVEGLNCSLTWQTRSQSMKFRDYYFKLCKFEKQHLKCRLLKKKRKNIDMLSSEAFNDLNYNPEEGYCVLQIRCQDFSPTGCVMGQTLSAMTSSVSPVTCRQKIRLQFQPCNSHTKADSTIIELDPVLRAQVIHWWNPRYPRS